MPHLLSVVLCCALCVTAALGAHAAPTVSDDATEAAFNALLSLPQGLGEQDAFPVQSSDEPPTDQRSLQAALQKALDEGADLNAFRHFGTLLHHALRANLQDTALWLLAHGADPRLEVRADDGKTGDGNDALQLAIVYRRWRVVDALLRRPALAPATDLDRAFRWLAVLDGRGDAAPADEAARQLAKRPLPLPAGEWGACLLAGAQDWGLLPMLLASRATAPRRYRPEEIKALRGREQRVALACSTDAILRRLDAAAAPLPVTPAVAADIERADARLAEPVLPIIVPLLGTPADVATVSRLNLRRPWGDRGFVRAVLRASLGRSVPEAVRVALLRTLPLATTPGLLDDDEALGLWHRAVVTMSVADGAWALKQVDDPTLARHAAAALLGLASLPSHAGTPAFPNQPGRQAPAATWSQLLQRLPAPLPVTADHALTLVVPVDAWPALFARRYAPSGKELFEQFQRAAPAEWTVRWPLLRASAAPGAAAEAAGLALEPWTHACNYPWFAPQPEQVEKLKLMADAGVRLAAPASLSVTCAQAAKPEALKRLLATGFAKAPGLPAASAQTAGAAALPPKGGFALAPLGCTPVPDPAIVRAILKGRFLLADQPTGTEGQGGDPTPDMVLPLDEPGARACAWLVSGGHVGSRAFIEQESFYDGYQRLTPCLEGTLYGELWRAVDGRVQAEAADRGALEGAVQLREAGGPRRYVLALPISGSTCDGGHPGQLMGWREDAKGRHLVVLNEADASRVAFEQACPLADPGPCFHLPSRNDAPPEPPAGEAARSGPFTGGSTDEFLTRFASDQRERYVKAFLALDASTLKAVADERVLPAWRAVALQALTASTMPVDQKRRRTAWMFRDKPGMAQSFGGGADTRDAVVGLVAWLPREDWRPLLVAIGRNDPVLQALREAAQARGDARLACAFVRAAGQVCEGGTR